MSSHRGRRRVNPWTSAHLAAGDLRVARRAARAQRDLADAMTTRQVRARHAVGWLFAALTAALLLTISPWLAPGAVVALAATWRGHRARWRRRGLVALANLPNIDPLLEARVAADLGLPESARMWRMSADH